jgi:hypothetical protein
MLTTKSTTPAEPDIRPIIIDCAGNVVQDFTDEEREFYQRWQPTSAVTGKNEAESHRVARKVHAALKQCWFNARKAIRRLPEYANATYVEGWAVCNSGMTIEHGWIVKDGMVVDPTLPTGVFAYFPGLGFHGRAGIEEFLNTPQGRECKKSPFFFAFGWGGSYSPSFHKSQEDAMAFVRKTFLMDNEPATLALVTATGGAN